MIDFVVKTVNSNLLFCKCLIKPLHECVLFSSGTTDISFIDPVVIGRNVFNVTNDFVSGVTGYVQGVLCAVLDVILDTLKGTVYRDMSAP